jgi:hypothetical protein
VISQGIFTDGLLAPVVYIDQAQGRLLTLFQHLNLNGLLYTQGMMIRAA